MMCAEVRLGVLCSRVIRMGNVQQRSVRTAVETTVMLGPARALILCVITCIGRLTGAVLRLYTVDYIYTKSAVKSNKVWGRWEAGAWGYHQLPI